MSLYLCTNQQLHFTQKLGIMIGEPIIWKMEEFSSFSSQVNERILEGKLAF